MNGRSVPRVRASSGSRSRSHWIKADLARLESENETDLAEELTQELQLDGVALGVAGRAGLLSDKIHRRS